MVNVSLYVCYGFVLFVQPSAQKYIFLDQFHCYFTSESEYFINSSLGKLGFITVVP